MPNPFLPDDFRAARKMLDSECFAVSEGMDAPFDDLVHRETWEGIMHLPDDVAIRTSGYCGAFVSIMHGYWSMWVDATGNPDNPDPLFDCMLDAGDCFQCATFDFMHGFYRSALANMRSALELVMIGTHATLNPLDKKYLDWKSGADIDWGYSRARKALLGALRSGQAKWMFEDNALLNQLFRQLCRYTHSRSDASDGALWRSNGPVFNQEACELVTQTFIAVMGVCYLLLKIARPNFTPDPTAGDLFEYSGVPFEDERIRAHAELFP